MEKEEHAIAQQQQDECDSLAAIFSEDFTLLNRKEPISYSIRLRPDSGAALTENAKATTKGECNASPLEPPYDDLALAVTYPPSYPDAPPIFGIVCGTNGSEDEKKRSSRWCLHDVQERALLAAVTAAARAEDGTPCVYGCVHAAREFLGSGAGLAQAGISALSDDCLASVLSYLATSTDAIDGARVALPIFEAASKSNTVWKELCRRRWSAKWGFRGRWERASDAFRTRSNRPHFWMETYREEETDAGRNRFLSRGELSGMTFDFRQWFSFHLFRNQPDGMRDVLPSGLRSPVARDVVFAAEGAVRSGRDWLRRLFWQPNHDTEIDEVRLRLALIGGGSAESLAVRRLKNWGWELCGSDYVLRAIDHNSSEDHLWGDLTKKIVLEEKPDWVEVHRSTYPYQYREIPDDEDYKVMLNW